MSIPITTHKKADRLSLGILLIGFAVLSFTHTWWPGILLVLGCTTIVRQYLRGRPYDIGLSTLIFGGLFLYFLFDINGDFLLPVLFTVAGIYLLFREYFVPKERTGEDLVEDETQEIEDIDKNDG